MPQLNLTFKSAGNRIPIFFQPGIWKQLANFLQQKFEKYTVYVIADDNVAALYGRLVKKCLHSLPRFQGILTFPAGERSKSRSQLSRLQDLLLQKKAGRDTLLIALGGGVTGDLVGFTAATLHRGVPLIHLPTSLLAQVDSSIGGKVGIDHPRGKNLLGSFYQPAAIFIDPAFLQTLPGNEFINGMAEVIKYGIILSPRLLNELESKKQQILQHHPAALKQMVRQCVELKIKVVQQDEKESHYRSILNFGHTAGHAIEQLSGFRVKHGFAVATGMKIALCLSRQLLDYPEQEVNRLNALLKNYHLERVDIRRYSLTQVWELMLSDKKARQQSPRFTLLDRHGAARLFHPVTKKEFRDAWEAV
jgi:3-dehydroquinate synthase